jgi:hypothetical protein
MKLLFFYSSIYLYKSIILFLSSFICRDNCLLAYSSLAIWLLFALF